MSAVVARTRELNTGSAIVIFNQVFHAFGHALGLDDAYRQHPDRCNGSAMLTICSQQRRVPSAADLDALTRLYEGASPPDAGLPPRLQAFDANEDGRIDDDELVDAVQRWIAGEVRVDGFNGAVALLEIHQCSGARVDAVALLGVFLQALFSGFERLAPVFLRHLCPRQ